MRAGLAQITASDDPAAHLPVTRDLIAKATATGCSVRASAQCGDHVISTEKPRRIHGHSLADGGDAPGVTFADVVQVASARVGVPSLTHDRAFTGPG